MTKKIVIQNNTFCYDDTEFTEEEILNMNLQPYIDTDEDDIWTIWKWEEIGEIIID